MARGNWDDFGNTIRDIVDDAITKQDFTKLNQTVNNVINDATDSIRSNLGGNWGRDDYRWHRDRDRNRDRYTDNYRCRNEYQKGQPTAGDFAGAPYNTQASASGKKEYSGKLYASLAKLKGSGLAMAIVGFIFAGVLGVVIFVFLLALLTGKVVGNGLWISTYALAPFFIASLILGGSGKGLLGRAKRYQQYLKGLGDKTYCNITELAGLTGKSPAFVKRDLRRMIQRGWFLEGHLDDESTCLMTDHKTFQEYQQLKRQREMIRKEEKVPKPKPAKEETVKTEPVTESEQVIREGEAYIREIQKSNDAIVGQEISAKISRMELLVRRIFERIQDHPEQLDDIQKLMNYYLPTTVKLLHAYEELDIQPVQGENILTSKKEIEATLDTLNYAFEKLLDNLFQDTAWDVSSDISVLHTMLSQEGLTKNDFQREETK